MSRTVHEVQVTLNDADLAAIALGLSETSTKAQRALAREALGSLTRQAMDAITERIVGCCPAVLRDWAAAMGMKVFVNARVPYHHADYAQSLVCPHGTRYWIHPTTSQIARWRARTTTDTEEAL